MKRVAKTNNQKNRKVYAMRISKKKIVLFAIMLLLLIGFVWGIIYLKNVADYKQAVKETTFEEINSSDISDGVYIGAYDVNFIYAKVEVTVQNGEITNIIVNVIIILTLLQSRNCNSNQHNTPK